MVSPQHSRQRCWMQLANGGLDTHLLHWSATFSGDFGKGSGISSRSHVWFGDISPLQLLQWMILVSRIGEMTRGFKTSWTASLSFSAGGSEVLCALPMWIFRPFSDLKSLSHWLHLKVFFTWLDGSVSVECSFSSASFFLFKWSSFLFKFLLRVDGLFFFFFVSNEVISFLVSKEKENEEPRVMLNVNAWPLLVSVWQNSRHWVASGVRLSAIFTD